MPGPPPKHPTQRARRNKPEELRKLVAGSGQPIPLLPGEHLPVTVEWWHRVWASPMATAYVEADIDGLINMAMMMDDFHTEPTIGKSAQLLKLSEQYGLTPASRRRLRWEIDEEAQPDLTAGAKSRKGDGRLRSVS